MTKLTDEQKGALRQAMSRPATLAQIVVVYTELAGAVASASTALAMAQAGDVDKVKEHLNGVVERLSKFRDFHQINSEEFIDRAIAYFDESDSVG